MELRSIRKTVIKNKRVILRVDFNVPIARGKIADDFRIRETLPTVRLLLRHGNALVLVTHLGRPDSVQRSAFSVAPVARRLSRLLKKKVRFVKDPFSRDGFRVICALKSGEIVMIENIRFWKGEEQNSPVFAKKLATLGDVFVNDAFGASHRAHASVVGIAKFLPSYAGLLLEREVHLLLRLTRNPARPFVAILGGAKISDKLALITRLLRDADGIILGGALANTIFAHVGFEVGKSVIDTKFQNGRSLYRNKKILFPYDVVVARAVREGIATRVKKIGEVTSGDFILDAGPKTLEFFAKSLRGAKTIVWNGPLGMTDIEQFNKGTIAFAKMLKKTIAFKVVGGGDTIAVLRKHNLLSGFSHVSTGGGAMLEFLAGKKLPGVEVLRK
ncbi:MAG: phosphoglycerate kinase [bacterium]|nr:phosphoglycerate kinase [bacterium]